LKHCSDFRSSCTHRCIDTLRNVLALQSKYLEGKAYCPEKGKFAVTFYRHDLTQASRERLGESESKFRALFNGAGYAMGLAKAGTQAMVNLAYLELFGYTMF